MRRFMHHLGAVAHRDADIGIGQGDGVVDAVADHGDHFSPAPQRGDKLRLVSRHHVGKMPRQADPRADRAGHRRVVAGHHNGLANAHAVQRPHHLPALGAELVGVGDQPGQPAVERDVETGIATLIQRGAVLRGGLHADLAGAQEALAAEMHVIPIDLALHAEPDLVVGCVAQRHADAAGARVGAQRLGHRVLQAAFRAHRETQQMIGGKLVVVRDHVDHLGHAVGQRAGLVEHDGVDLGQPLHVAAAFDDDAGTGGMRHRCQHAGRRRDADAGAVVDDDQREEAIDVGGQHRAAEREAEGRQHQPVGETFRVVLHPRVADRRVVDELGDLAGGGAGPDAQRAHRDLALAQHGGGEHRLARRARDRQALAGDGLLVDQRGAVGDLAVHRDHLAGIDHHQIAGGELGGGHRGHHAVAQQPGRAALEVHQLGDRALRSGRRQVADPVAEADQPGDDAAGDVQPLDQRGGDRQRVEEVDVQPAFPPPDAPGAPGDRHRVPQHQRHVERERQRRGGERQGERDRRQRQHRGAELRRRLGWRGGRAVGGDGELGRGEGRLLDLRCRRLGRVRQRDQVAWREVNQVGQHRLDQRAPRLIVGDDQAGAGRVDPRAADAVLGRQPGDDLPGCPGARGQRRNVQPDAPRDPMADGELHRAGSAAAGRTPGPAMTGPGSHRGRAARRND